MLTPMLLMVVICTSRPFQFCTVHKLLNQFDYEKKNHYNIEITNK